MKYNELISIVVPIYNVEKYLERCVDSIINQTYKNIEIILVDDGATDNCGVICDKYKKEDPRIIVIHKKNGGLSDARNSGIKIAKGKYITFIDSDDYIEDDYVEYLYNLLIQKNTKMSICSYAVHFDNSNVKLYNATDIKRWSKEETLKHILYSKKIEVSAWGKMYRTDLFKNIEYPKGKIFEDIDTTYKLIDQCDYISVGLSEKYHYIMRKNSIVNNSFSDKHKYMITASEHMCDYIKNKYPSLKKGCKRRLTYAYISTLNRMIVCENRNISEEKKYRKIILKNWTIIFDFNASLRDKLCIFSLFFGLKFYKYMWNFYRKKTGRC